MALVRGDAPDAEPRALWEGETHPAFVTISPDSTPVAVGFDGAPLVLIDREGQQLSKALDPPRELLKAVHIAFHPHLPVLAACDDDSKIELIDTRTAAVSGLLVSRDSGMYHGLAFSADGRLLEANFRSELSHDLNAVQIWHIPSRRHLLSLDTGGCEVRRVLFSSDGRWLAGAIFNTNGALTNHGALVWDLAPLDGGISPPIAKD